MLARACLLQHLLQMHIFSLHPSAVEPENVEATIVFRKLHQLVFAECAVVLPPLAVLIGVELIVSAASGTSVIVVPEPLAVPVGLGEVAANPEVFLAEGIEDVARNVRFRIAGEGRSLGDGEIRIFRVEHAEAIMVLRGENHILHASVLHDVSPLVRVELVGVKERREVPIPFFVAFIGETLRARNPVFRTDGPAFADARHGVDAPMEEDSEFQVLPFVELVQHGRVVGSNVAVGFVFVYKTVASFFDLCRNRHGVGSEECRCCQDF